MTLFYERLLSICNLKGTTPTALLKALNLSTSKVTAWKNGTVPKLDLTEKIAEYFGVEIDYFTEADSSKLGDFVPILTEREQELLRLFRANEAKQEAILDLLKK